MGAFALGVEVGERRGRKLFQRTGVLWLSDQTDAHLQAMAKLLPTLQAKCEKLSAGEVRQRFPQLRFDDVTLGVLEPESGVLMARQAVQTLAEQLVRNGVEVRAVAVLPPRGEAKLAAVKTSHGQSISAAALVYACV